MSEEVVLPIPNLAVPQHLFISSPSLSHLHEQSKDACWKLSRPTRWLLPQDTAKNTKTLAELDERLESARRWKANPKSVTHYVHGQISSPRLESERRLLTRRRGLEKTPGLGSRIDIALTILKVYKGLHLLSIRQFKRGGELLLDALSTFTATELLSYNDFVALTVIANTDPWSLIQLLPEQPTLGDIVKNLYECHYDKFFVALATLEQTHLLPSRFLSPHTRFYVREMRILAYNQLLNMGQAFGVRPEFIDNELSHFISTGRLNATIDKVHGVVETTRMGFNDSIAPTLSLKSAAVDVVLKQGDLVLGDAGRLSRVLW
ncbi:PCI-domain-containing protein [Armillaria luteobubalina]|uniref:PCI-domain-containing protein n=1 Tax=Armillaria luteobubalina TaxID=153913 RepID=A0AA39T920_9AGAR|nr:PCI-domain-containing protein [Armillaria luteobubalina]